MTSTLFLNIWKGLFSTISESIDVYIKLKGSLTIKSWQLWNKYWLAWPISMDEDTFIGTSNQKIYSTKMAYSRQQTLAFQKSIRGGRTILITSQQGGIAHQKLCSAKRTTIYRLTYLQPVAYLRSFTWVTRSFQANRKLTCYIVYHACRDVCRRAGRLASIQPRVSV